MIKLEYEQLKALAKNQLCADHQTPVVVVWHKTEDCYTLLCGEDHYPDALVRNLSLTELYKSGESVPSYIEDNIKRREKRKAMSQQGQPIDAQFALVPHADLATGQLLLPEEVKSLIVYAEKYSLDPYRGHVVLMYSKPYITLDGYLFYASRQISPYKLTSRPLGDEERKTYRIEEKDHAWIATVELLQPSGLFTGLGIVTKAEMEARSPRDANKLRSPVVAAHPWQLAQKRAEWQALRRAFPIGESEEVKDEA